MADPPPHRSIALAWAKHAEVQALLAAARRLDATGGGDLARAAAAALDAYEALETNGAMARAQDRLARRLAALLSRYAADPEAQEEVD
ncbi:MAG: hypothetical protein R6X20_04820 [Phycisphaerae bacterium]